jgi:hypothetical protein
MRGPLSVMSLVVGLLGFLLLTGTVRAVPGVPRIRGRDHGWLLMSAAVAGVLVAYAAVPQSAEEQRQQEARDAAEAAQRRQQNARRHATAACHVYIENQLKVPSSAKFSYPAHVEQTERGYFVGGRVEAQNAFGVMLRSTYACAVDADGRVLDGRLE